MLSTAYLIFSNLQKYYHYINCIMVVGTCWRLFCYWTERPSQSQLQLLRNTTVFHLLINCLHYLQGNLIYFIHVMIFSRYASYLLLHLWISEWCMQSGINGSKELWSRGTQLIAKMLKVNLLNLSHCQDRFLTQKLTPRSLIAVNLASTTILLTMIIRFLPSKIYLITLLHVSLYFVPGIYRITFSVNIV